MLLLKKYKFHLLFIFFLMCLFLAVYKDYGLAWEEGFYHNIGKYYLDKILGFLNISTNLELNGFVPPTIHLQGHGVIFDVINFLPAMFLKVYTFETYHLIKALMAIPTFILLAMIVNQNIDSKLTIIPMILLLFFPAYYGQIFINSIDVSLVFLITLYTYYFFYLIKTGSSTVKELVLAFILALNISQRLIMIYLIPISFFILLVIALKRKKLFYLIKQTALVLIFTFVFMHLLSPYLFFNPIRGFATMIKAMADYGWHGNVLFEGKYQYPKSFPWYYLPKTIFMTSPLVTVFLFAIGLIYLIYLLFKKDELEQKLFYFYLLTVFFLPILSVVLFKPTIYDGWRQFLFLTSPLILIAVFGFKFIIYLKNRLVKMELYLLLIIGFILVAKEMIALHPYQYLYYNEAVGGLAGAYGKYETDYLGVSFKEAVDWFNQNINTDKNTIYKVTSTGDPFGVKYFLKQNSIHTNLDDAQYVFSYTRWNFHKDYPGKIIHIIKRQGVPLNVIKKL